MVGYGENMNKSILIVDDEPDFLDVIEVALVMGGYHVTRAKDGRQAWEILDHETPGIILSDYSMPRMNGCELFELVRGSSQGKDMPFIFMSATPELISSVGTYSVLRKPFQFDALMAKVGAMCS